MIIFLVTVGKLGFSAVPANYDIASISQHLQLIKDKKQQWLKKQQSKLLKNPLEGIELSQYHSGYYLNYYSGLAYYLASLSSDISESLSLLAKAKVQFEKALASELPVNNDINNFYLRVITDIARKSYKNKNYFKSIKTYGRLVQLSTLDQIDLFYLADSLSETKQKSRLRLLTREHHTTLQANLNHPILKKKKSHWQKLLSDSKKVSPEKSKSKAKPAMVFHWEDCSQTFRDIKNSPFADHSKVFLTCVKKFISLKGASHRLNSKEKEFVKNFNHFIPNIPPKLLLKLIYQLWNNALLEDASKIGLQFIKNFPYDPSIPEVKYDVGRIYEDNAQYKLAYKYFLKLKKDKILEGTKYEEYLHFRLAWMAHLSKSVKTITHFEQYLNKYPEGAYASTVFYYLSQYEYAKKGIDKQKTLRSIKDFISNNPLNSYSIKMLEEYQLPKKIILDQMPMHKTRAINAKLGSFDLTTKNHFLLVLYEELHKLGLHEEAFEILKQIKSRYNLDSDFSLYHLDQGRKFENARLRTLKTMGIFNKHPHLKDYLSWKDLYPQFSEALIRSILAKTQSPLSYNFVVALIRQESAFDTKAKSTAKAQGLMQLMPYTAKSIAKSGGISSYDLTQAEDNLELGIRLLNRLHEKYKGRLDYILCAYNAGEGHADKWIKFRGHLPQYDFIESIPFGETRNYVKLIFRNQKMMKILYN